MIRFAFTKPEVQERTVLGLDAVTHTTYHVQHPSNSAILAYCDTKPEAEACAALLGALIAFVNENQTTVRGIADAVNTPPETPNSKKDPR